MDIRSPMDQTDPRGQAFGPPIVPGVTELSPFKMRAVMRGLSGMEGDEGEDGEDPDELLSPAEILAKVGKLAYIVAQHSPEFLNMLTAAIDAVKAGMQSMVLESQAQMPSMAPRAMPMPLGTMGDAIPPVPQPPISRQPIPSPPPALSRMGA